MSLESDQSGHHPPIYLEVELNFGSGVWFCFLDFFFFEESNSALLCIHTSLGPSTLLKLASNLWSSALASWVLELQAHSTTHYYSLRNKTL